MFFYYFVGMGLGDKLYKDLLLVGSSKRATHHLKFMQAFPGGYAEGDKFIGVTNPDIRKTIKKYMKSEIDELSDALHSEWHEVRVASLFILVEQYQRCLDEKRQKEIVDFYLNNVDYVNHWDLVDCSAYKIIGHYYFTHDISLESLALDKHFWRRRIGIVSHFFWNKNGKSDEIFKVADVLIKEDDNYKNYLQDKFELTHAQARTWNSLVHKATGWMLREAGKYDSEALWSYLQKNYSIMPSIMRSYAIEKLSTEQKNILKQKKKK